MKQYAEKDPLCTYCKDERESCDACMGTGCEYCKGVSLAIRRQEESERRADHYREMGWVR